MSDLSAKQKIRRLAGLELIKSSENVDMAIFEHANRMGDEMDSNMEEINQNLVELQDTVKESAEVIVEGFKAMSEEDLKAERESLERVISNLRSFVVELKEVLIDTEEKEISTADILGVLTDIKNGFNSEIIVSALKTSSDQTLDSIKSVLSLLTQDKVEVESAQIDLSKIEEFLSGINAKEIPIEDGRVLVKLSEEDLQKMYKAFYEGAKEIRVYSGGSGQATEETLQRVLAAVGGAVYTVLQDAASSTISYFGYATPGTATSAASWQIFKLDTSSGLSKKYAASGAFTQIWDNRAALTYA